MRRERRAIAITHRLGRGGFRIPIPRHTQRSAIHRTLVRAPCALPPPAWRLVRTHPPTCLLIASAYDFREAAAGGVGDGRECTALRAAEGCRSLVWHCARSVQDCAGGSAASTPAPYVLGVCVYVGVGGGVRRTWV
eukprot:4135681-Prymnesium_polylepis.1